MFVRCKLERHKLAGPNSTMLRLSHGRFGWSRIVYPRAGFVDVRALFASDDWSHGSLFGERCLIYGIMRRLLRPLPLGVRFRFAGGSESCRTIFRSEL